MCGIIGMVAQRDAYGVLIEGLRRLEYRGYDSAGVALVDDNQQLHVRKTQGKVRDLDALVTSDLIEGQVGIAHTRWATHGVPNTLNSHPHISGGIAVAHNGIVENHQTLRGELIALGYVFVSETDTEVIAHLIHKYSKSNDNLLKAVQEAVKQLEGAYALVVVSKRHPFSLIGVRSGSPLIVGVGVGECYLASDQLALRQVTDRFIFLEEGDSIECRADGVSIFNANGSVVQRHQEQTGDKDAVPSKGDYRHFMQKEIFEQSDALIRSLRGRLGEIEVNVGVFGYGADDLFGRAACVHIVACGTSFHAGLVAKHWIEKDCAIPCLVEVASEYRYRRVAIFPNTLFVTLSQSGETADTLAALRKAKSSRYLGSLSICNVANSTLVRESDLVFLTQAGPEIGVASTKAFTTQLVALRLLSMSLAKCLSFKKIFEFKYLEDLRNLPIYCDAVLKLDSRIKIVAEQFVDKNHSLFLGRGEHYPIALEGALKLKEISYIHAEAYPAGELKHGPLALIDENMPVVVVAPTNDLLDKLKSNLAEVRARGGTLFLFADANAGFEDEPGIIVIKMPKVPESLKSIIYTVPLQLLAYHVAVLKGTDVDQPRNLAKSVTVE